VFEQPLEQALVEQRLGEERLVQLVLELAVGLRARRGQRASRASRTSPPTTLLMQDAAAGPGPWTS
jgi:hypothetical protein